MNYKLLKQSLIPLTIIASVLFFQSTAYAIRLCACCQDQDGNRSRVVTSSPISNDKAGAEHLCAVSGETLVGSLFKTPCLAGDEKKVCKVPQACKDFRSTYKAKRKEINTLCTEDRKELQEALQMCKGLWTYCGTPCDQDPPKTNDPEKDAKGEAAFKNLCEVEEILMECRDLKKLKHQLLQIQANEVCCPYWPCKSLSP